MKILFLQLWYDLYGGIETVNDTLASQFVKDGYKASILCLWKKGSGEYIHTDDYSKEVIDTEPIRASYKKMVKNISHLNFKTFIPDIKKSLNYYKTIKQNKNDFTSKIVNIDPDFIIVSNPELIKLVPPKYYSKTVIHLHTGMQFYHQNPKLTNLVLKYSQKINKVIFLTPNFVKEGQKLGFSNSTFMDNPVRVKSTKENTLNQKKLVFIGRIAPEKRVDKLVQIFNESKLCDKNWNLNIYGTGDTSNLDVQKNVNIMGGTNNVKEVLENASILALTSEYEGFPMVVLEAYACGVPVIAYDYGISSKELIIDGETGFVIPNDNKKAYIEKLKYLCENPEVRQKMGKAAKEKVKKYYPENVAKRWYKLFRGEL